MSTTTRELPRLDLELRNEWNDWDNLVQVGRALVEIGFEFDPGQRAILRADPDDCQQGFAPSVTIYSIKLTAPLHFAGDVSECTLKAGTELMERLSPSEVSKLEDEILSSAPVEA